MMAQDAQLLRLLADLSANLLLSIIFLTLVALCVTLWLVGRGIAAARAHVPEYGRWVERRISEARSLTEHRASATLDPQVEALSALSGLRAAANVMLTGKPATSTSSSDSSESDGGEDLEDAAKL